jgi:hypothetical protein
MVDRRSILETAIIVLEAFLAAEDPLIEDVTGYSWGEIQTVISELEDMYLEMDDDNS